MSPNRNWLLYGAVIICILLVLIGAISYPTYEQQGPFDVISYIVGIPLGIIFIFTLVYFRGRPEAPPDVVTSSE